MHEQSFFHCALQMYGQDWTRFDKKEKNYFSFKALVVAKKKTSRLFTSFPDLILSPFSRPFPGLENCWANFKTFSRIQVSVQTLQRKQTNKTIF